MARIPLVEPAQAPPDVSAHYQQLEAAGFGVFNVFKVVAHRAPVLAGFIEMVKALYFDNTLAPRHRELAYLRASQINDCHY